MDFGSSADHSMADQSNATTQNCFLLESEQTRGASNTRRSYGYASGIRCSVRQSCPPTCMLQNLRITFPASRAGIVKSSSWVYIQACRKNYLPRTRLVDLRGKHSYTPSRRGTEESSERDSVQIPSPSCLRPLATTYGTDLQVHMDSLRGL